VELRVYAFNGKVSVIAENGEALSIEKNLVLKVKVTDNLLSKNGKLIAEEGAVITASGKLDATQRNHAVIITVSKLSNIEGAVTSVAIADETLRELFETSEVSCNAKGQSYFTLRIRDGVQLDRSKYSLAFDLNLEHVGNVKTNSITLPITQTTAKATVEPTVQTIYQGQSRTRTVVFTVKLTTPVDSSIQSLAVGEVTGIFHKSLSDAASNISWNISSDRKTAKIYVTLKDSSELVSGKQYVLPIILTPEGATNQKANAKLMLKLKIKA